MRGLEAWQLGRGREEKETKDWAEKPYTPTGLFFPFAMSIFIMFVSNLVMT